MRRSILAICLCLAVPSWGMAQASGSGDMRQSLSRLHDELHLSAAQEAAWRSYEAAIEGDAQADARRRSAGQLLPTLPTPRRIALIDATMTSDLADFRRQSQAVLAFYNQLTGAQQKTFDRVTLPPRQGIAEER